MFEIIALMAASFALNSYGMVQSYNLAKQQAALQKAQMDIKINQLENEKKMQALQEELKIREERAKSRQKRAAMLVRGVGSGLLGASTLWSQQDAETTSTDVLLRSIRELGNYQTQNLIYSQKSAGINKDLIKLNEPTTTDLMLGIAGAGLQSYAMYLDYSNSTDTANITSTASSNVGTGFNTQSNLSK